MFKQVTVALQTLTESEPKNHHHPGNTDAQINDKCTSWLAASNNP